jgi:hypothetical protein
MILYTSAFAIRKTACLSLALAFLALLTLAPLACTQPTGGTPISITSPVSPGNEATITVYTAPNAKCRITVLYKSGPSKAQGLVPKSADSQGRVSWTWRVGMKTVPGTWPIEVNCSSVNLKERLRTSFVVR